MENQSNFEPSMSNMIDESMSNLFGGKAKRQARRATRKAKRADKKDAKKGGSAPVTETTPVETDLDKTKDTTDSTKTSETDATPTTDDTKGGGASGGDVEKEKKITDDKILGMKPMTAYFVIGLGVLAVGAIGYVLLKGKPVQVPVT